MKLSLKNRLRLISLLPIIILFFITSYFVFTSYKNYKSAEQTQQKLSSNKKLGNLVNNISRERGMTVLYLGNSSASTFEALTQQRKIVDVLEAKYLNSVKNTPSLLKAAFKRMKAIRLAVDTHKTNFKEVYSNVYGDIENIAISELENISLGQRDNQINNYAAEYITFLKANKYTAAERDYISYAIAQMKPLTKANIDKWISLIANADALNYSSLRDENLIYKLNKIFISDDTKALFEDINSQRATILITAKSGTYSTKSAIWFAMLSEKINIISNAQDVLLTAIDERAVQVKTKALKILTIILGIWIISIILAILSFLLSNEITRNIHTLENILKRVAEDTNGGEVDSEINLHTTKGTQEAYELLENIIEQTKKDKELAQEASQAKSIFLANMSHEIRTPLIRTTT